MTMTAFERAGGFSKLRTIVADLYDRALESETLRHHFTDVDMRMLIDHQTKFIASLMGGPAAYPDDALKRQHARLNITHDECDEMVELLRETLEDSGISPMDIEFAINEFRKREHCIVTQGGPSASDAKRNP